MINLFLLITSITLFVFIVSLAHRQIKTVKRLEIVNKTQMKEIATSRHEISQYRKHIGQHEKEKEVIMKKFAKEVSDYKKETPKQYAFVLDAEAYKIIKNKLDNIERLTDNIENTKADIAELINRYEYRDVSATEIGEIVQSIKRAQEPV